LKVLGDPVQNGGATQQFQRGFGRYTDQNTPFLKKVKTNGKALESSIPMDLTWKGSKLLKGTNYIVPGQNMAFSSKRRLIRMSAAEK